MTEPDTGPRTVAPTTFTLQQYPETLAVVRLGAGAEVPEWAESSSIFSVTATAHATSVVCAARSVPKKAHHQRGFTAFEVQGPLDFELTGVLVALLTPLAEAEISVFTLSTFDTDWILIAQNDADRAAEAWRRHGHTVVVAVPAKKSSSRKNRS
ncbi:hypothetical protein BH09ACT12_BH09ACT12_22820 [soil metagenome]